MASIYFNLAISSKCRWPYAARNRFKVMIECIPIPQRLQVGTVQRNSSQAGVRGPFLQGSWLGRDNEHGYAKAYKEVVHEDALKVEGSTRAPDYCFRIGGVHKLFGASGEEAWLKGLRDTNSIIGAFIKLQEVQSIRPSSGEYFANLSWKVFDQSLHRYSIHQICQQLCKFFDYRTRIAECMLTFFAYFK